MSRIKNFKLPINKFSPSLDSFDISDYGRSIKDFDYVLTSFDIFWLYLQLNLHTMFFGKYYGKLSILHFNYEYCLIIDLFSINFVLYIAEYQ